MIDLSINWLILMICQHIWGYLMPKDLEIAFIQPHIYIFLCIYFLRHFLLSVQSNKNIFKRFISPIDEMIIVNIFPGQSFNGNFYRIS